MQALTKSGTGCSAAHAARCAGKEVHLTAEGRAHGAPRWVGMAAAAATAGCQLSRSRQEEESSSKQGRIMKIKPRQLGGEHIGWGHELQKRGLRMNCIGQRQVGQGWAGGQGCTLSGTHSRGGGRTCVVRWGQTGLGSCFEARRGWVGGWGDGGEDGGEGGCGAQLQVRWGGAAGLRADAVAQLRSATWRPPAGELAMNGTACGRGRPLKWPARQRLWCRRRQTGSRAANQCYCCRARQG